jgi:hypothetical protein
MAVDVWNTVLPRSIATATASHQAPQHPPRISGRYAVWVL